MCGILALYFKSDLGPEKLRVDFEMLVDSMKHRGPDGKGIFKESNVLMGNRRLAIIDLTKEAGQPMRSADGRFVLIFNGEIYNYRELGGAPEFEGVSFRTQSDTEILLESFVKMGPNALHRFNGMFAFAIWDRKEQSLFVARDRFGIKPLYYYENEKLIAFSSEIKAILPLVEKLEPNDEIVYDFLAFGRVDHLDKTFFRGIHRFPAGCYGIVGRSGLRIIRWYDISQEVLKIKAEKEFRNRDTIGHVRTLRRLFFNAVNLRLRSDVRVGSCLSGGIDSSSVVSVATRLLPQETEDIFQTYSAVYGSWFNEDERKYIEMLSSKTRTNSNFVTPTLPNFKDQFSHFIYHQEEPVTSPSPYSQLCVMKLAHSDGTKVLLDGQGADEILAGYDYMLGYYLAELLQGKKLWRLIKEIFMAIRRRNSFAIKSFIYQFLPKAMQRRLAPKTHRFLAREFGERYTNRHLVENLLYLDRSLESASINHIRFKLQHLLRWEDKNAMAFSIETRVPFLDHNLVTYVISLSSELKIRGGYTKWILRRAVEDLLPRSIRLRTDKIGFAAPEHLWINQSTESFLQNLKTCEHPLLKKYVDINELRTFLENRRGSLEIDTCRILFRVMCLYQWLKVFFNGVTC